MKILNYFKTLVLVPAICLAVSCDNNEADNEVVVNEDEQMEDDAYLKDKEQRENDSQKFVAEVASHSMMEVQLAELAQTKAQSQAVKDLAATIKSDHEKANQELKSLASEKNWTIPNEINDTHRDELEDLKDETPEEFDQEFVQTMVESHRNAIDMFESEAEDLATYDENYGEKEKAENTGNKMELRKWINQILPTLRKHLQSSEELEKQLQEKQS